MKTERRHELQENELANWLGDKLKTIEPYGKTILGLLVLGAVAFMATSYIRGRSTQARQAAWASYFDAIPTSDAAALEDVAQRFPGTNAADWALQRAADLRLDEAIRQMFQNREVAQQELQAARELYERLLEVSGDDMIRQRAAYGLGKCLESQGQFDDAVQQYESIVATWPDSQFASMARERIEDVNRPATKQWYNWFAAQKPVVSPLNDPNLFQDLPDLPESPDLQMPKPGQLLTPNANSSNTQSSEPATDLPESLDLDLDLEAPAEPSDEPTVPSDDGTVPEDVESSELP